MIRVLVLDDYQKCAADFGPWSNLVGSADVEFEHRHLAEEELLVRAENVDVIVAIRERTPFPRHVLERLRNLRLLITTAPSNVVIDVEAAVESGVIVCGTRRGSGGVTEHAWALILALVKNVTRENQAVRAGSWGVSVSSELKNSTLGIVGLGHLGTEMLPVARAFGMNVIAWSENLDPTYAKSQGVTPVSKQALFSESDVISIHLRLSDRTRSLVGQSELDLMKPTAYLVNTSRGPIIDDSALIDALQSERIAGAALDVFTEEPLPAGHPFLALSNLVITPHTGYVTRETYQIFFEDVVEDIEAFLKDAPIRIIGSP